MDGPLINPHLLLQIVKHLLLDSIDEKYIGLGYHTTI